LGTEDYRLKPVVFSTIEPSISSKSHPVRDIAEEAMRLLRKQITHLKAMQQQVTLYTTLVVNKSTDINASVCFPGKSSSA
jgi:DNA-binding LacI/PurR family transcriptional regulator